MVNSNWFWSATWLYIHIHIYNIYIEYLSFDKAAWSDAINSYVTKTSALDESYILVEEFIKFIDNELHL